MTPGSAPEPQAAERFYYQSVIKLLSDNKLPFLVGGAHALRVYTGIERNTKDFDVFIQERDLHAALKLMEKAGFRTELTDCRWIAKAFQKDMFVDFIFAFGNSQACVDDEWFAGASSAVVFGEPVLLIPAEEMLWSKAYIMDRDRFDGADIMHIILRCGQDLNWQRLLKRFDEHWRLLLIYILYFEIVYPGQGGKIPDWLREQLLSRLASHPDAETIPSMACDGMLFSRSQYRIDFNNWGFFDARQTADSACKDTLRCRQHSNGNS